MLTIDLNERYKKAFGYVAKVATGGLANRITRHNTDTALQNIAASVVHTQIDRGLVAINEARPRFMNPDFSGHPEVMVYANDFTFANLKLKSANDGKVYEFKNSILTDGESGIFAAAPMMSFIRPKKIVCTAVQGNDNVVVENFGLEQWSITIEGLLVDLDNHQYPTTKVQQLRQMFETPDTFDVLECQVMTDLGINALYFEKLENLAVVEDYPDTVKYKITAKSIQPPEFTLDG